MKRNYSPVVASAGYSLIEVMLACGLGLFLMLGLMQIYLSAHKNLQFLTAINQLQENARFASHYLQHAIQLAGDASCVNPPPFVDQARAIRGYQQNLPSFLPGKVVKDTDSLVLGACRLEKGRLQFAQYAYVIGKTTRKNKLGEAILALYEVPEFGAKRELVANVAGMKIHYGIATNDGKNIDSYLPAAKVRDWSHVKIVEIALLLISENPILEKASTYTFADQILLPSRLLRREWNVTVGLRERL